MTRAARIIEFVERYLRVPEGKDVGQPMVLAEFQKQFIRDVFAFGGERGVGMWSWGILGTKMWKWGTVERLGGG